jgi:hypothetical protein
MRALSAIALLVLTRLRRERVTSLLAAAGVAASVAMLTGVAVVSLIARDAALSRGVAALAPSERAIRAMVDRTLSEPGELDRLIEPEVSRLLPRAATTGGVIAGMLAGGVRASDGTVAQVLALDQPGRWVRLIAGRAPGGCDGSRCEAVVVGGPPPKSDAVDVNGLRLVVVGRGVLSAVPFGQITGPVSESHLGQSQEGRYELNSGGTRYLLAGVAAAADAPALRNTTHTYFFTAQLRARSIHPWNVAAVVAGIRRARAELDARESGAPLQAPDDALAAEQARGEASARRLLLLASQAAVALLAFAAFAASRRRRSVLDERERLEVAGARRWQLLMFVGLEAGAVAGLGAVAGWCLATVGALISAQARGLPAGSALSSSVLAGDSVVLALAGWLAALAVIVAFLRSAGSRGRVGGSELVSSDPAAIRCWWCCRRSVPWSPGWPRRAFSRWRSACCSDAFRTAGSRHGSRCWAWCAIQRAPRSRSRSWRSASRPVCSRSATAPAWCADSTTKPPIRRPPTCAWWKTGLGSPRCRRRCRWSGTSTFPEYG